MSVLVEFGQPQVSAPTVGETASVVEFVTALLTLVDHVPVLYMLTEAYSAPACTAWRIWICCEYARPRSMTGVRIPRKIGAATPNSIADMPRRSRANPTKLSSVNPGFAASNVLVNSVCPGFTQTARLEELAAKRAAAEGVDPRVMLERMAEQVPLKRLGKPEEFANVVVFLASERASYVTGQSISIDGGFVKGIY